MALPDTLSFGVTSVLRSRPNKKSLSLRSFDRLSCIFIFLELFGNKNSHDAHEIDWEVAARWGQDKWRAQIAADFNL